MRDERDVKTSEYERVDLDPRPRSSQKKVWAGTGRLLT